MSQVPSDRARLVFPWAGAIYEPLKPFVYPLIRVSLGLILMPHGFDKLFRGTAAGTAHNPLVMSLFPNALFGAYFVGGIEFFGGLFLALGLLTRLAAAAVAIEMLVISFFILWPVWYWTNKGMEFAIFMAVVAIAIFIRGGGKYSLDARLPKEL